MFVYGNIHAPNSFSANGKKMQLFVSWQGHSYNPKCVLCYHLFNKESIVLFVLVVLVEVLENPVGDVAKVLIVQQVTFYY